MVSRAARAREKIPRTLAHRVPLFKKNVLTSLVCWFVGLLAYRRWSIGRHLKSMDFGREGDFVGPYLAAPPTSARVQNRVEFVVLTRDLSSNLTREVQAGIAISRQYQLSGCGTSSYHTLNLCQVHLLLSLIHI